MATKLVKLVAEQSLASPGRAAEFAYLFSTHFAGHRLLLGAGAADKPIQRLLVIRAAHF